MGTVLKAFPTPSVFDAEGNTLETGDVGMTLRDYFMAHAPAIPQDWFMPVMQPCPIVTSIRSIPEGALRDEIYSVYHGEREAESCEAIVWLRKRDALIEAQKTWQSEFKKQLCIQWPAAWADAMLEQRKC
jgi:hypothetical protein